MNRIYVFIMACMILFTGCGKKVSDEIDFGAVEDSTYRNNYFGLSMKLPPEWNVQSQEMQQKIMDIGATVVAGDDENLKAVVKASELQTVNLLAVFKHPIGAPVAYNPNIVCLAERIRHMPGIKRGKDYHFHSKKLLESSQIKMSFPKDIYTEQIGGIDFDIMTLQMHFAGQAIKQKQYVAVMKGYALLLLVSFTTNEEEAELEEVLASVCFE